MRVTNKTTPVSSVALEREEDAGILQSGEEAEYRAEGVNRKIVGVQKGPGGHARCIAQYGPYDSAKHRLLPTSKDVLMQLSKPIGELKIIQNGEEIFKYTRANVKATLGVALPHANANESILDKVDLPKRAKISLPSPSR